ncbi:MAG: hypothetical protein C5B54_01820 [Acidobacteria bacterium]|nr:MAG: hypothetical protein C5B54_01820 [Acidobacteriota bacterium]
MLEVGDLEKAIAFYSELLGIKGRPLRGSRAYFDCGSVILAVVDPTPGGLKPKPNATDVYFSVKDIKSVHARAVKLECLSKEKVHDQNASDLIVRPWGELSFYAVDPWDNGLCFVDEKTEFTGK